MVRNLCVSLAVAVVVMFASSALAAEEGKTLININTATVEQLTAVPVLNPDLAKAIVSYREEMGDIQSLDELLEVKGVTKDLLEKMKAFIGLDALSGAECSC